MKKIIIFLLISITMFGLTQADVLKQVSTNISSVGSLSNVDTKTQIELSKQEAEVIARETENQKIAAEDYEKSLAKDIEVNEARKESLYSSYLRAVMNKDKKLSLFGKDIIDGLRNEIVPLSISKDYILGMGDVVSIKVWSDLYSPNTENTNVLVLEIGKTGQVFIPNVGSFSVIGKSIRNLEREITTEARKKVRSLNSEISLEKMREISVFVAGEVNKPGYVVTNPFANMLNILNMAGGINDVSSLRNIKIIRQEKEINIDLYEYFLGKKEIRELQILDGDTIFVPLAKKIVAIEGQVNRPAYYEIRDEKNYSSLIQLAGGYTKFALKDKIEAYSVENSLVKLSSVQENRGLVENLFRIQINTIDENNRNQVFILGAVVNPDNYAYEANMTFNDLLERAGGYKKYSTSNYATIIRGVTDRKVINFNPQVENVKLEMYDEVYVYDYNDINRKNYATINGAVVNSGTYEIYEGTKVLNMIFSAKGIDDSKNPYMQRADLFRIDNDGKMKVLKINLNEVMKGNFKENITVKNNDVIRIYSYNEVVKPDDIFIYGDVREPGKYRYYKNMTLEDLVFYAKGLQNRADSNITVVRNSNLSNEEFVIDLNRNPDFALEEGDLVFVRKKAQWVNTRIVTLAGYVTYQVLIK